MYLAIDPGAGRTRTIGWAEFSDDGTLHLAGQWTMEEMYAELEKKGDTVTDVIFEQYRIDKGRMSSHVGSEVETIQCIGAIKAWASRNGIRCHGQNRNILKNAEMMFGIKMPKDHTYSHQISAMLHGMHYLHSRGLYQTVLERKHGQN